MELDIYDNTDKNDSLKDFRMFILTIKLTVFQIIVFEEHINAVAIILNISFPKLN